jgi:hypothetical protein
MITECFCIDFGLCVLRGRTERNDQLATVPHRDLVKGRGQRATAVEQLDENHRDLRESQEEEETRQRESGLIAESS